MPIDEIRAVLFAFMSQPLAVATVIFLAGIHAAVWLVVFERVGFPTVLAALMLVPPFTFFMPFFLALSRWPAARVRTVRYRARTWNPPVRPTRRAVQQRGAVQQRRFPAQLTNSFGSRRALPLAADGLPLARIPFEPTSDVRIVLPAHL